MPVKECIYYNTKNDNQVQLCIHCGGNDFNYLCAHCGKAFSSAFCPQCGTAAGDTGWKCPKCNAQVFGQFCQRCGHSYATQQQKTMPPATPIAYGTPSQSIGYGAPKPRKKGSMRCPTCNESDITLLSSNAKKASAVKIGLGVMTGGASLLFTGTKTKGLYEVYCNNCGHRWKTK